MWEFTGAGEWVWMLRPATDPRSIFHPDETYHLRVWYVPPIGKRAGILDAGPDPLEGWHAAIVLDGDYQHHIVPQKTDDLAKAIILAKAREVLGPEYQSVLWTQ